MYFCVVGCRANTSRCFVEILRLRALKGIYLGLAQQFFIRRLARRFHDGSMIHVLSCITGQHDLRLVALAAVLCALAVWSALSLIGRAEAANETLERRWLLAAALVFGSGVWATHFVAMLAFQSHLPLSYGIVMTAVSIAVAIAISAWGFFHMTRVGEGLVGGAIVGIGIIAMHYIGMVGATGPFRMIWSSQYVALSIGLGLVLGAVAGQLWSIKHYVTRGGAVLMFVLAICSLHFTGMSALTLVPAPVAKDWQEILDPGAIAVAVAAVAFVIVLIGMVGAQFDSHLAKLRGAEAQRLHRYITELEATKEKLEHTTAGLSDALEKASVASAAKSAFLAAMSHELRTPLNAVIGFSELMLSEALGPIGNPKYIGYVGDIRKSGTHLLALINDILDLSRMEAGNASLTEERVKLATITAQAIQMIQPQARSGKITVAMTADPCLSDISADPRRMKQILLNLLSNAVKFTPEGGRVAVRLAQSESGTEIAVSDTGIGIAAADIPRALEAFGQVDSRLARRFEGTGLGLPLARELVELHGGTLALESAVNVGTTVTIRLPSARVLTSERKAA
jgi:signal transduction histidine kinase